MKELENQAGITHLVLEYYRVYHGLRYDMSKAVGRLPSPETIARVLRFMKASTSTSGGESLEQYFGGG